MCIAFLIKVPAILHQQAQSHVNKILDFNSTITSPNPIYSFVKLLQMLS